jgi:glycosyltransferase 2 family protein
LRFSFCRQEGVVNKQTLGTLLKYFLAVGLLSYVIYANWGTPGSNGLGDVWQRHVVEGRPVHLGFFFVAFVLYSVATVITLLRWYILVRAQDLPITLLEALRLGLIGCFYNAFLPGSVGGDIIKAASLARGQSRRTVAVATVIMDRVIALWGLIWFVAVLGSGFWLAHALDDEAGHEAGQRCKVIVMLALAIVAVSTLIWLLMGLLSDQRSEAFAGRLARLPRVGTSAAEFWRAVWMYRRRQLTVGLVLALSWIGHVGFCIAFYCSARTLLDENQQIPSLTEHFLIVPIGLVFQALIPVPGGIGFGEMGFGALYEWMGRKGANGVLGSLVQRVISWCIALIGLGVYSNLRVARPQLQPESEPAAGPGAIWKAPNGDGKGARPEGLTVRPEPFTA